jgi:hypothetical protein
MKNVDKCLLPAELDSFNYRGCRTSMVKKKLANFTGKFEKKGEKSAFLVHFEESKKTITLTIF